MDERRRRIREEFIDKRGNWSPFWDGILELDPDFVEVYLECSGGPWRKGPLEPKFKELVYTAIDASTTQLYEPRLRQHSQNALRLDATSEEILEVYELTSSVLATHTIAAS
jgi:alkylhydroperoxidase/carboxymuconolactone decarboxylase family protein YurZ